jgi:hypothetical protein
MGKSWTSPRRKLPTKGCDRQEGCAASLGQKRPGVNNASSTKKKKQSFINDDSANDSSTGRSGRSSLDLDSEEDNDPNQKGRLNTNLTEKSRTELVKRYLLLLSPLVPCTLNMSPGIKNSFLFQKNRFLASNF